MTVPRSSAIERWFRPVLEVPLIRFLGAEPIDQADPASGLRLEVGANALNAAGVVHGGTYATLLDLAAYLAVLPALEPDEQAVTHALSTSYLRGCPSGSTLFIRGELLRRMRRIAHTSARISRADGDIVATASVTKSIIRST